MWVILCHLPEKGRKEIEEIHVVEEMKERNREERGTGMEQALFQRKLGLILGTKIRIVRAN